MSEQWYLHKEGNQYGPYTWEELSSFAREGRVMPGDSVWHSGMAGWAPVQEVAGLMSSPTVEKQPGEAAFPGESRTRAGSEELLGTIPALNKKVGLIRTKTYTLVVTNKQLILAELTNKMLQAAAAEANEQSKGKGISARMKEVAVSRQRICDRYHHMAPQHILRENADNFAVNNDEVKTVRMHIGTFYGDQRNRAKDRMVIHTTREKITLTFHYDHATGDAKKILWRALGNKVK